MTTREREEPRAVLRMNTLRETSSRTSGIQSTTDGGGREVYDAIAPYCLLDMLSTCLYIHVFTCIH